MMLELGVSRITDVSLMTLGLSRTSVVLTREGTSWYTASLLTSAGLLRDRALLFYRDLAGFYGGRSLKKNRDPELTFLLSDMKVRTEMSDQC